MRDSFERAVDLFGELCDLEPEEQARRLATLEVDDPDLRSLVEEILLGDREPDDRIDRRAEDFIPLSSVIVDRHDEPVAQDVLERLIERGRSLEHYRVNEEVARGGMGAIFQVYDEDIERSLAMKVLGGGEVAQSSVGRRKLRRFLDEARVTGQLDHPGIVPVHDLGIDSEGRAYFTMKFVKGQTLQEVFDLALAGKDGWSQPRALHVLLRVCEAMAYAHAKGVVHRDLKPSNVMVGRFGEVYVMDWGVAWLRSREDGHDLRPQPAEVPTAAIPTGEIQLDSPVVTLDGTVVGTPYYMSPEQARGGWIDERSDVYAIGAMLYNLVSGRPPYRNPGDEATPYDVLARVVKGPPTPIVEGDTTAELAAISKKAMARAAEERYASVSELGDDLRAYLEGRVVQAHQTGSLAELRKWTRRNRGLAFAATAAFVFLAVGLVTTWILKEEAVASEEVAQTERANALRLLEFYRLKSVVEEVDRLWPAHPENRSRYDDWLAKARGHLERRATLVAPDSPDESWTPEAQSLLVESIGRIERLSDPERGLIDGIAPDHGWGIARRRAWAEEVEELTVTGEDTARSWRAAIASIGDPATCPPYGGMVIEPQIGLLPIGRDPTSGLWEFAHPQTGEVPERDDDGRLLLTEGSGLVFVLLPGGTFSMGAQAGNPNQSNLDPRTRDGEGPVHEVRLTPFFLSKYELTQAQWLRMKGENPSFYHPGYVDPGIGADLTLLHPVEKVTWNESREVCRWLGLELPTEAQWEYAARAGTTTPWWPGEEREWLMGVVNLADQAAARAGATFPGIRDWPQLDDGFPVHAPVDSLEGHPFGLHHIHGNVWEWCRDTYDPTFYAESPAVDPLNASTDSGNRVSRGGSFRSTSEEARIAFRRNDDLDNRASTLGLRPARPLTGTW